jgi:hypothetical protein
VSYLDAIVRARHGILKDMEEPDTLLVSITLKHALLREVSPMFAYRCEPEKEQLMGMRLEWTKPKPLTEPQMAIRTKRGDTRIVSYTPPKGAD